MDNQNEAEVAFPAGQLKRYLLIQAAQRRRATKLTEGVAGSAQATSQGKPILRGSGALSSPALHDCAMGDLPLRGTTIRQISKTHYEAVSESIAT